MKLGVVGYAFFASACSLLLDGSDLRGDAGGRDGGIDGHAPSNDAGFDATMADGGCIGRCDDGQCCIAGTCVDEDADGDGYPRAECAPGMIADCEDGDRSIFPWPPRHMLSWTTHAKPVAVGQIDLVYTSDSCALVAATSVALNELVIDRVAGFGGGCGPVSVRGPLDLTCSAGAFATYEAIDLRGGTAPMLTVAGTCGTSTYMRVMDLAETISFDVPLSLPATEIQLLPLRDGDQERAAYISRGTLELRIANPIAGDETNFGPAADDWVGASRTVAAVGQGESIRFVDVGDYVGSTSLFVTSRGRAALIELGSLSNVVIASRDSGANTELVLAGPFASVDDPISSSTVDWSADDQDPMFAGVAYRADRFVFAGASAGGVFVRIGRADGEIALEDGALQIPLVAPRYTDLAIDVFDAADRIHVAVAVATSELRSTRFTICAPSP